MILPQFSLRWMLGLTVCCAFVFAIVRAGLHGSPLAAFAAVILGLTVMGMLLHALLFGLLWLVSLLFQAITRRRSRVPTGT